MVSVVKLNKNFQSAYSCDMKNEKFFGLTAIILSNVQMLAILVKFHASFMSFSHDTELQQKKVLTKDFVTIPIF